MELCGPLTSDGGPILPNCFNISQIYIKPSFWYFYVQGGQLETRTYPAVPEREGQAHVWFIRGQVPLLFLEISETCTFAYSYIFKFFYLRLKNISYNFLDISLSSSFCNFVLNQLNNSSRCVPKLKVTLLVGDTIYVLQCIKGKCIEIEN